MFLDYAKKYLELERKLRGMAEDRNESVISTGRKSELYREITPDSYWGFIRPGHLEITFFTTQIDSIGPIIGKKQQPNENIAEIHIKLTPQLAKQLASFLIGRLALYEKAYGEIAFPDEKHLADLVTNENEIISEYLERIR